VKNAFPFNRTAMRRLAALAFVSLTTVIRAQDPPPIAKYVPPTPNSAHVFVLDSAHILSARAIAALQDSSRALQGETGADVAWVTLPTLGGRPIEEAALYIGRTWRIGSAGQPGDPLRNRGLVVLYVPDRTKTAGPNFRIEVGNGLEGTITDSRSRTITAAMRDALRAKRYDDAYLAGWNVAGRLVREDFAAARARVATTPAPEPRSASRARRAGVFVVVIVMVTLTVGVLVLIGVAASRKHVRRGGTNERSPRRPRAAAMPTDEDKRRRERAAAIDVASSSSSDDSSSSSSGGDYGGGGGFSGGGSSDTI
jgi:uncharacterized protein